MTDYEVVKEIEVLREFAAGICADLIRYKENNPDDKFAEAISDEVCKLYNGVYKIDTLKQAYIVRGKLQMVNETLKKLVACRDRCMEDLQNIRCMSSIDVIRKLNRLQLIKKNQ